MAGLTSNPRWSLAIVTEPVNLPLTLGEVKSHLDIPDSDETDDADLMGMLRASTIAVERYLRRSLVDTTWTLWMDRFPGKLLPWWDGVRQMADTTLTDLTESIYVPRPPLSSVTHVKAHTQAGTTTTVTAANYIVDAASEPGRIALKVSQAWPTEALRAINGVEIEFVAGYGPVGSDVPAPIRHALLIWIGDIRSNPEGTKPKFEKVGESSVALFAPEEIPIPARNELTAYKSWMI